MTVFEIVADDWSSRSDPKRIGIGLFSTYDKAEAKIKEIKNDEEWMLCWSNIRVHPLNVE